jgi:hypothetical protein
MHSSRRDHVELIAIRYEPRFIFLENKDSKDYSMDGKVSGSSSSIKIPKGTTTISWNGSGDFVLGSGAACTFHDGKIVGGTNYTISGGKASK